MIIRYHLSTGDALDEEVTFGATVEEMTASLVDTMLTSQKTALGTVVTITPMIRIQAIKGQGTRRPVPTFIMTDQLVKMELILSEMEERREAGAEGKN